MLKQHDSHAFQRYLLHVCVERQHRCNHAAESGHALSPYPWFGVGNTTAHRC